MESLKRPISLLIVATLAGCGAGPSSGGTTAGTADDERTCPCPPLGWWHEAEEWTASVEGDDDFAVAWIGDDGLTITPGATRGYEGSLSRGDVVEALEERIDTVVACLVDAARSRTSSGHLVVNFTVLPNGSICGASLGGPTRLGPEVEACVTSALCDWTFPSTTEPVIVAYPIFLEGE